MDPKSPDPGNKLAVASSPQAALALVNTRGVIRDLPALRDFFEAVRHQAVVLAPVTHLSGLPDLHRIQITAVMADPVPGNGDVYQSKTFTKPTTDGRQTGAPTKNFLMKILAAAGISMEPPRVIQNPQYVWNCTVMLTGRGLDGQPRRVPGDKEIDLRDGAPLTFDSYGKVLSVQALGQARVHAAQMATTKAILRGLRAWYGMKQAYPLEDFQKPWIVPALVLDLNSNNPEHLKYIIGMSAGATDALFGQAPGAAGLLPAGTLDAEIPTEPPPPDDDEDVEDAEIAGSEADIPADEPPPPPAGPPKNVCACGCGHQVEVTETFAKTTHEKLGIVLCVRCVPNRHFDEAAHASLKKLNFPKRPEWNDPAAAIAKAREERAKPAAAK